MNFFMILVLSVLLMTGLSTYANQTRIYKEQNEQSLRNIVEYLAALAKIDGNEFIAYQNLMIEYSDKVLIPHDFDGNFVPEKIAFYEKFNDEYPGKIPGYDVDFMDMTEELKILYLTYKHEYWLHVFEEAKRSFDVDYTYYVVPTGEELHMYYMIDAIREVKTIDGKDFILLNMDVEQSLENHSHMWETWNTGEYNSGYDVTDNELGVNRGFFYPLIIDGQKLGVVCADIASERVNKSILDTTLKLVVSMGIIIIVICAILSYIIGKRYVARLIKLKGEISEFSETKDSEISHKIMDDIKGDDEIYDLARQTSIMISELGTYMNTLVEKNRELIEAQDEIRAVNELANKDALTGVRNKTAYDNEVAQIEYKIAKENFYRFGIAMVDLNYLKMMNDSYGHDKGNIAIKKVCSLVCRKFIHSPVFRIGGDEFVVILENQDYDDAEMIVSDFKETINKIHENESLKPWERISAAIGWTLYDPKTDEDVQSVFKRADNLMYEDKKAMKAMRTV